MQVKRFCLFILAILHFILFFICIKYMDDRECIIGLFFSLLLSYGIFFYLLSQKIIDLYEPIILFSLFNLFTPIVQLYVLFFSEKNLFLSNYEMIHGFSNIYNLTTIINFFAYLFCLLGYSITKRISFRTQINILFPIEKIIYFVIIVFPIIAFLNFFYNATSYGGNALKNPLLFYTNVSEINKAGTTLYYNLAYFALYLYLCLKKRNKVVELFLLIFSFLISISTLRIFSSLIIILTYFGVIYKESENKTKNKRIVFALLILLLFGVYSYYLRYSMSAKLSHKEVSLGDFLNNFMYFAFDKGNTPNIALQMFLYDRWSSFLLGKTYIAPFLLLFPNVNKTNFIPACIVKENYFMMIQSGNLPVTGVGEFYMNFGYSGIFIGMFIFGMIGGILNSLINNSKLRLIQIICIYITVSFYMLFPKGEINNLSFFVPIGLLSIFLLCYFYYISVKKIGGEIK